MPTSKTDNKEVGRRDAEEIWGDGNVDLIDELVADDFVAHSAATPEPVHGPEGYKEFVSMVRTAFPDLQVTVEDMIAADDTVVLRNRITGTHDGEFLGIEPTGTEVEIHGIDIDRIEDGQIVESWGQPDMLSCLHQLGVVELPGE